MTIGIIGLGYVGLTLAIAATEKGLKVYGIEIDNHIKNALKENTAHFYEPNLDNLIKRHNNKDFYVVDKFSKDIKYDAFVITVGTPLKNNKEPNFQYIKDAISSLSDVYDGSQLIILRSTVSVGTTENIVLPYLSKLCGKDEKEILVSMCPERTIEGNAVYELTNLPQVVSGNSERALEKAKNLFNKITPTIVCAKSIKEAELIKLYCNTYRDMTFAIGNAFCMAAEEYGVDGISCIENANFGYSRSNIAKPGFVAGPCLEKDAYILINNMSESDSKSFILASRKFNESLIDMVVDWVKMKIGEPNDKKYITLSGIAFKGEPETSDLRGSSSVYIAKKLHSLGYKLILHDFNAYEKELKDLNVGEVCSDIYEAAEKSSLLLVLNNNKKYNNLVYKDCFSYKKKRFIIFDSWKVCKELYHVDDIKIYTLGNMFIKENV